MNIEEMTNNCIDCKHCIPCKRFVFGNPDPWKWFYICDKFAHEKGGFAMYLGKNADGQCEEWIGKE